jgi:hypothetical protein
MKYEEEDACMPYTNSEEETKSHSLPVSLSLPPLSLSDSLPPSPSLSLTLLSRARSLPPLSLSP